VTAIASPESTAEQLLVAISLLFRRIKQTRDDALSMPETAALSRLDRLGPSTLTALAKVERISAQSLGATLASLEERQLVCRAPDPSDGRQTLISLTKSGRDVTLSRRNRRARQIAQALASSFTRDECAALLAAAPLLERLANLL
jgi:DNA-binding MarR family transcriptional regulator